MQIGGSSHFEECLSYDDDDDDDDDDDKKLIILIIIIIIIMIMIIIIMIINNNNKNDDDNNKGYLVIDCLSAGTVQRILQSELFLTQNSSVRIFGTIVVR